ncbi:MAG: hypothetical protein OEY01_03345 [Desulfobulbaceae bacterium]|nr:hypothetical protein [Desulfobulbaceae bacterium]
MTTDNTSDNTDNNNTDNNNIINNNIIIATGTDTDGETITLILTAEEGFCPACGAAWGYGWGNCLNCW